ncbi:MAG: PAS domain S-box protein [Anaerolineae bacterium]|nr:PAS domain S-box protein [Anaerolineae bacterium]
MKRLDSRWTKLTASGPVDGDKARHEYMTQIVLTVILITLLCFTLLIAWSWLFDLFLFSDVLLMLGIDAVIGGGLWAAHRGGWKWASALPPTLFFLIAVALTYQSGFFTSAVLFYVVTLMLTAILRGVKSQWWMLACSLIAYLVLGWMHIDYDGEEQAAFVLVACGAFLGVALLQWLSIGQLQRALDRARALALELERSEDKYRRVVENANESILVIQNGLIRFFNPNVPQMLGIDADRLAETSFIGLVHLEDRALVMDRYQRRVRGEQVPEMYTFRVVDGMGQVRWAELRAVLIDWEGAPATLNFVTEITARKQAESERERLLADLERRNVQLQTAAQISQSTSTVLEPEELIGRAVSLIQERFDFYYVGLFLVDEASGFAILRAGTGDAGRQMLAQGHKLAVGGESMIGQCVADAQARIALDIGHASARFDNPLLPLTRSEMALPLVSRGQCIGALTVQSDQEAAFSSEDIAALQTMADHLAVAIENARLFQQLDDQLTQSHLLNMTLSRTQRLLQSITDSMPSALVVLDAVGQVLLWNPAADTMTGCTAQQIGSESLWDRCSKLAHYRELFEQVLREGQIVHRHRDHLLTLAGEVYCDVSVFPLTSDVVEGAVLRVDDVSQRVQLEEMMLQSAKMASVGGLAAGVAHEINNPLGAIIQSAQMLQLAFDTTRERTRERLARCGVDAEALSHYLDERGLHEYLQGIRSTGERAAKIVSDLLSFSRYRPAETAPHDLNELIEQTLELAATDYNLSKQYDFRNIDIVRELAPGLPQALCDGSQIQQVVLNLLRNAAQAMSGAHDDLCASREGWYPRLILRTLRRDNDLILEVEDNGPGMPQAAQSRLFEPFFTTKEVGEGTGLGLWLCWSIIVERHKGVIRYEAGGEGGARFVIALPLV